MTCTNKRFNQITTPLNVNIASTSDGDESQLGVTASATQYDPIKNQEIETLGTLFSHDKTSREGAYILNRDSIGDYKFYIDSMAGSGQISRGFTSVTYHNFKSG